MKKLPNILLSLLFLSCSSTQTAWAQTREICTLGDFEPAADTTSVVLLDTLGIELTIPSNYRTLLRQDGSVTIASPDSFEMFQCLENGGRVQHGFYEQKIKSIPRQLDISFAEQVKNNLSQGQTIRSYNLNSSLAYLIEGPFEYSVELMILMPDQQNILVLSASCDCEVEASEVIELANGIRFIEN